MFRFVGSMSLEDDLADDKTRYAVMRCSEILGEAVRHMPEGVRRTHPEIPWMMMSAVRNRIVHGYFGIDDTILFTTIAQDLKPLLPVLEALVREQDA